MNRLACLIAAALAGVPLLACATGGVGDTYVSPQVGGSVNGSIDHVDNGVFGDLTLGHNLSKDWSLEVNMDNNHIRIDDPATHRNIQGLSLDALRVWDRDATVAPYVSFGAGAVHGHTLESSPATGALIEGGAGLFVKLWHSADNSSKLFFRPDIKARWDDVGTSGHVLNYIGTVGVVFAFGAADPAIVTAHPIIREVAPPPQARHDTLVPLAAPVLIELNTVHFDFDRSALKPNYLPGLERTARSLETHPELAVEVQGHTDSRGSAAYNQALSVRRAKAVRQYLIGQGVPGTEMTAKGYGKTQPVASNATAEGRAKNRRTVIKVLKNPNNVTVEGDAP